MDYKRAIETLTDIIVNEDRFDELIHNIFDAVDTDASGTLNKEELIPFIQLLISGIHQVGDEMEDRRI